jgi:nucleotide-binding universal stress UspA family protein
MRILYATDGSEGALAAGRFLAGLPSTQHAYVHIVTAVRESDTERGNHYLEAAKEALGEFPGQVTTAVMQADSTSQIVETLLWAAEYLVADMIVVGAQGHSSLARFFLGSVAERLARHSPLPVLLARSGGLPLRKIVIGLDGSLDARHAACWATSSLSLPEDCAFHLVRVVPQPVWEAYPASLVLGSYDQTIDELTASARQAAREAVEAFARELNGESRVTNIGTLVGDPARELLRVAETDDAGLIVVGSRGLTGLQRAFLGSVSGEVIHGAHCSVLVVPHKADEAEASRLTEGANG